MPMKNKEERHQGATAPWAADVGVRMKSSAGLCESCHIRIAVGEGRQGQMEEVELKATENILSRSSRTLRQFKVGSTNFYRQTDRQQSIPIVTACTGLLMKLM